jgi:hypothetical protein
LIFEAAEVIAERFCYVVIVRKLAEDSLDRIFLPHDNRGKYRDVITDGDDFGAHPRHLHTDGG